MGNAYWFLIVFLAENNRVEGADRVVGMLGRMP